MRTKLTFCKSFTQCLFIISAAAAVNYCSPKFCNNSKQHTLCRFRSSEPASVCLEHERTIRTEEQKQALLDKINSRRSKIASGDVRSFPAAENMMRLVWNEELELSAQRWADQCVGQNTHHEDTCRDLGDVSVGQTIASVYGEAPGLSPLSLVDVWYMELLNANSSVLPRYRQSTETGFPHYDYFSQLVWARSSQVGCGSVKFKERIKVNQAERNRTVYRLVCNFAPSGNIVGEPVYTEGPPCSRCPDASSCDTTYTSLCSVIPGQHDASSQNLKTAVTESYNTEEPIVLPDESSILNDSHDGDLDANTNNDKLTIFDYFSEMYDFTRQPVTIATPSPSVNICKDALGVDEFVELLKKKLTTDQMFKELLSTKQPAQNGNIDSSFTDPSVAAFVSRIYSKKEPMTTTKLPEQEYVNSTLLIDLVEAVIFRSGDKTYATEEPKETPQSLSIVSPVKIQAELGEVKLNHDFTGHYFFPEDVTDESVLETTDTYYDTSNLNFPVSDVLSEIENIQRSKVTSDFLDEIIDSDTGTDESSTMINTSNDVNLYTSGQKEMKKFLEEIGEKNAK